MGATFFKYSTIFIGLLSVGVSVIIGNENTPFVKPVFHVFLFSFYYVTTKKINIILFAFLAAAMLGELLAANNFEENFRWIAILFTAVFSLGIILLKPVLDISKFRYKWTDILIGALVFAGLSYLISLIFFLTANELEDFTYLVCTTVAFCVFVFSTLFIAAFGDHPKRIFLFMTGAGYIIVVFGTIIYELLYSNVVIIGIVNLCEIIAQFAFVYFIIHRNEAPNEIEWFE